MTTTAPTPRPGRRAPCPTCTDRERRRAVRLRRLSTAAQWAASALAVVCVGTAVSLLLSGLPVHASACAAIATVGVAMAVAVRKKHDS